MKARLAVTVALGLALAGPLAVHAEGEGESTMSEATNTMEDATITAKVKTKFAADERVKASDINVDTENGVVSLRGNVATAEEAQQAEDIARNTEGVRSVRNELRTAADESSMDMGTDRTDSGMGTDRMRMPSESTPSP